MVIAWFLHMGLYPSDEICFTYTNTKDNTWFQLKTISGTRRELSFYYNEVKLVPDKLNSCHNTCLLVYLFPSLLKSKALKFWKDVSKVEPLVCELTKTSRFELWEQLIYTLDAVERSWKGRLLSRAAEPCGPDGVAGVNEVALSTLLNMEFHASHFEKDFP